jgi:hypothetical protein
MDYRYKMFPARRLFTAINRATVLWIDSSNVFSIDVLVYHQKNTSKNKRSKMKTEKSNFGFKHVEELLEKLPETFRSSQAVERVDVGSKKLGHLLTWYADQEETDLYRVQWSPPCYSRHDLNLTHSFAKHGLDLLNKSVQTIWENGEMTKKELEQMKHYAESEELNTQIKIVGELKDVLDEQYPGIEYNLENQEFYRVD